MKEQMTAANGRWGGRLTSRPLPFEDPEIDQLPDVIRERLAAVWWARSASERRVAEAFERIAEHVQALSRNRELVMLSRRAVDDELRHAELALAVASRFAGRALEAPPPLVLVVPPHPGLPPRLVAVLHVLGHSAMNETFASAFLEAALRHCAAPLARAATRALLSDEIDHARIGWALLAELDQGERRALTPHLPALVAANLNMWRSAPRDCPADPLLARHGAPSAEVVECALLDALRDLILPGLAMFGLPTSALGRWVAASAPTSSVAVEPRREAEACVHAEEPLRARAQRPNLILLPEGESPPRTIG
jgi:hypothetical protein